MSSEARWAAAMPEIYDRRLGPVLFAPFAEVLTQRAVDSSGRPNEVLELAAGTGILTRAMLARLPDTATMTATDLNTEMVDLGSRSARHAQWQQADAQSLPFADGRFDLVVCAFGAMFFPDKPAAIGEIARVLMPGGRFVFTVWDSVDRSALPAAFVHALQATLPDNTPDFLTRIPHGYFEPEHILADLRSGHLMPVRIERVTITSRAPSARAVAEGFCQGTPLRFALEDRGDLAQLTTEIGDRMTTELGRGRVRGPLTALVVAAVKPPPDQTAGT